MILVLSAIVFQTGRHYVKAGNLYLCVLSFPAFVSRCAREQLAWQLGVDSIHALQAFHGCGRVQVCEGRPQPQTSSLKPA